MMPSKGFIFSPSNDPTSFPIGTTPTIRAKPGSIVPPAVPHRRAPGTLSVELQSRRTLDGRRGHRPGALRRNPRALRVLNFLRSDIAYRHGLQASQHAINDSIQSLPVHTTVLLSQRNLRDRSEPCLSHIGPEKLRLDQPEGRTA